jgi:hypothetical protein
MGFLDRFRTSKPAKQPRGASGRGHFDGYLQLEELNPDLQGQRGLEVFDKMYWTDPDVRKNVWMIINLLISATWSVEPYGKDEASPKDQEAAEYVRWALFENMRPGWKGHLAEALPVMFRSGFSPFEHLWENTEWNGREVIAPRKLDLRLPRTIERFLQENGELVAIEQQLMDRTVRLPAEDLLYYRVGAEGDNWEGRSLLRPAYKPWFLKDKIERLDAIKQERQAVGVPVCYPPRQASPDQVEGMEEVMANLRSGEQAFVVMPGPKADTMDAEVAQEHGWTLEILGHKQTESSDTKPSLEYHSDKIAAALLAEFMRLGQGGASGGSRAVGQVQQNPFLQAAEALSSVVESVVNDGLVTRMVALNFEVEGPPKLVMSLVDDTSLNELAEYVSALVEKGALHPDDELEDFLRDRADLPPADPQARKDRVETAQAGREALQNAPAPPPKGDDPEPQPTPKIKPQGAPAPEKEEATKPDPEPPRWGRELREWERFMSLEEIDNAIAQAREAFQDAAGDTARSLASEFAVAAMAGKVQPKAGPELAEKITTELQRLYRTGRATVADELNRQRHLAAGNSPSLDAEADALRRLKTRARLAAESITARIWQAVSRSVLNRGGDLPAAQAAGEVEATAAIKAESQLHASAAVNEGRSDQADFQRDEIEGSRYTSILDRNRCSSCASADDNVLRKLDDPVRIARKPPNQSCQGGDRCRCMEAFQLKDESEGFGGDPAFPSQAQPGGPTASNFEIRGGDADLRQLVTEQLDAIDQVHRFPQGLPRVSINIENRGPGRFGAIKAGWDGVQQKWVNTRISLDKGALKSDPPITSAVHEVGHFLDQWGFGDGPPVAAIEAPGRPVASEFLSGTVAMREWREAIYASRSHRNLVLAGGFDDYLLLNKELLARSYEQYIAEVSQNAVLLAKIAKRREENPNLYWDTADFHPIAAAFDRFLTTRGLR